MNELTRLSDLQTELTTELAGKIPFLLRLSLQFDTALSAMTLLLEQVYT